jgi:hypothetical protein
VLGDAAERALGADDSVDPGDALISMMAAGLVTRVEPGSNRSPR